MMPETKTTVVSAISNTFLSARFRTSRPLDGYECTTSPDPGSNPVQKHTHIHTHTGAAIKTQLLETLICKKHLERMLGNILRRWGWRKKKSNLSF